MPTDEDKANLIGMANDMEVVGDPSEAEHANAVVCMRLTSPLLMPDNLIDRCSKCGLAIQHRPNVPKKPPKFCYECILPIAREQAAKGELQGIITEETMAEVVEFLWKKSMN